MILTLVLIAGYYFIWITGDHLARQGRIAPSAGIWAANFVTALVERLKEGDHEAARLLWQRYYPQAAGLTFLSEIARPPADPQPDENIRAQLLALPPGRQRRLRLEDLLVGRMGQVLRLDANQALAAKEVPACLEALA